MSNNEPHIDSPLEGDDLLRFSPPSGDDEAGARRSGTGASAQAGLSLIHI